MADSLQKDEKKYLFDNPKNVKRVLYGLYTICAGLFLIDFVFHRHVEHTAERIYGFYGIYGFVACVVLVLLAKEMRKILMRKENYYDPEGEE